MNSLFAQLTIADVHQDVARNIVSLRESQDLFDDLTEEPAEWLLANPRSAAALNEDAQSWQRVGSALRIKRRTGLLPD